jgi:phosphopantothenoylcysteine decarboxylase/phosphopantothenate--cysteine ligase
MDILSGKILLITAGPTWEAIDPVRGISNHSSGKMGYALAEQATNLGAHVLLVSGPVCLAPPAKVEITQVQSAREMYVAVHDQLASFDIDIFIGVAAVADYRPAEIQTQKIKKSSDAITLRLIKNPDIIASVAALSSRRPYTVGFAAETQNLQQHARDKLQNKRLDMIVANDVSQADSGFGVDQNRALIITQSQTIDSGKLEKSSLAELILQNISQQLTHESKRTDKNSR